MSCNTPPTSIPTIVDTAGTWPQLMTTADVATLTRSPEATVRYWRYVGTGPRSFKIGRRVLYRSEDVIAWIEQQANEDPTRLRRRLP